MKLTCIVDNLVASGSLWGEHGLSVLIEARGRRLLFDTGQSGDVLLHNLRALNVSPDSISGVVLSHGHKDHTGGLLALLPHLRRVPLWVHPEAFGQKYSERDREAIGMGDRRQELARFVDLQLSEEPAEVLPGIWTTGEVKERPHFEGRGAGHVIKEGDAFLPDPYGDDLSLVLQTRDGLVLLCGCAHAGLLNILDQVRRRHQGPLLAVVGGTHLGSARERELTMVADYLRSIGSPRLYLNHCTGFRAEVHLARLLPENVYPFGAGTKVEFAEEALA